MADLKLKLVIDADGSASTRVVDKAGKSLQKFGNEADKAEKKTAFFSSTIGRMHAYLGGITFGAAVSQVVLLTDGYKSMSAQLRSSTQDHGNLASMQQAVGEIALSTGAALGSTATTFARINRAVEEMGGNYQQTTVITQALNDALNINRATTAEAASAQIQFSQAIGSGVLRGEEFNSMMESAPTLMIALAQELGVTTGELRTMAEDGQLTADVVLPAMTASAEELRRKSEEMGLTIPQHWQNINTSLTQYMGTSQTANGLNDALGESLKLVGENIGLIINAGIGLAGAGIARMMGNASQSALKWAQDTRTTIAAQQALRIATVESTTASARAAQQKLATAKVARGAAAAELASAQANQRQAQTAAQAVGANQAQAAALQRVQVAQAQVRATSQTLAGATATATAATAANTAAMRANTLAARTMTTALNVGKGALALLGGPVGAVMVAAGAIGMFALSSKNAKIDSDNLARSVGGLRTTFDNMSAAALAVEIRKAGTAIQKMEEGVARARQERNNLKSKQYVRLGEARKQVQRELAESNEDLRLKEEQLNDARLTRAIAEEHLIDLESERTGATSKQTTAQTKANKAQTEATALIKKHLPQLDKIAELQKDREKITRGAAASDKDAERAVKALDSEIKKLSDSLDDNAGSSKGATDQLSDYEKALQDTLKAATPLRTAQRGHQTELQNLETLLQRGKISQEEHNAAVTDAWVELVKVQNEVSGYSVEMERAEKQTQKNEQVTKQQTQEYQQLYDKLYPVEALTKTYHQEVAILTERMTLAGASTEQIRDAQERLGVQFGQSAIEASGAGEKIKETAKETAGVYGEVWKSAFNRLDGIAKQGWRDMIDGTKSVGDTLKDWFKDLLAELAHTALTKPIVIGLTSMMSGGAGNAVAGAASSALGGSGAGGAAGAGSLLTAGPSFGYATLGTGLVAGAAGYAVGSQLGGYGGEVGAAGSMVGMVLGGPIGAAIGTAIGSAIGSMFGQKWETRSSGYALNIDKGQLNGQEFVKERKKRSFGRRSRYRTTFSDMNSEVEEAVADGIDQFVMLGDSIGGYFGHSVSEIDSALMGFSTEVEKIKIGSKDAPAQIEEKLTAWVNKTGGQIVTAMVPELGPAIERAGDRASEVIQPLLAVPQHLQNWESAASQLAEISGKLVMPIDAMADQYLTLEGLQIQGSTPDQIMSEINAWIAEKGGQLLQAVMPEFSGAIQAAGDRTGEIVQPLINIASYLSEDWAPAVQQAFAQQAADSYTAVQKQLAAYDGSVEATQQLSGVVQERYQVEEALLLQIDAIAGSVTEMTGGIKDRLERMQRSDAEQIEWLTTRQQDLRNQLQNATDPNEINALVKEVTRLSGEQIGMLGEEGIKAYSKEFGTVASEISSFMDSVNQIAQDKLAENKSTVESQRDELSGGITEALSTGTASFILSAEELNAAQVAALAAVQQMSGVADEQLQNATQIASENLSGLAESVYGTFGETAGMMVEQAAETLGQLGTASDQHVGALAVLAADQLQALNAEIMTSNADMTAAGTAQTLEQIALVTEQATAALNTSNSELTSGASAALTQLGEFATSQLTGLGIETITAVGTLGTEIANISAANAEDLSATLSAAERVNETAAATVSTVGEVSEGLGLMVSNIEATTVDSMAAIVVATGDSANASVKIQQEAAGHIIDLQAAIAERMNAAAAAQMNAAQHTDNAAQHTDNAAANANVAADSLNNAAGAIISASQKLANSGGYKAP